MSASSLLRWTRTPAKELLDERSKAPERWDAVNAAGLNNPFMSALAVGAALREFGRGNEQLCIASEAGQPVAMMVLSPVGRLRWSTFQPSQLPLGAFVAAYGATPAQLANSLVRSRALPLTLVLSLTQLDPLHMPRASEPDDTRSIDYIQTGWLELTGNFADYWAARGKNLRQNMRKQRNKLADAGVQTRLLIWRDAADMAAALDRYGALESAGWKLGSGTAVHRDNAQGRFYSRLLEEAATRGEALVTEYRFGDKTVAMNLGLTRNGIWTVLKTAYDESIDKSLSPASLLREAELQHFFASGEVRRMEYYGRLMEWHTRLTDLHRTLYHLTAFRWPWMRRLADRRAERTSVNAGTASHGVVTPQSAQS